MIKLTDSEQTDIITLIARKRIALNRDGADTSKMTARNLAARTAAYCDYDKLRELIEYLEYIKVHYGVLMVRVDNAVEANK